MATVAECEAALHRLATMLGQVDDGTRGKHIPERVLECQVTDLDTTFRARLSDRGLEDIAQAPAGGAQITVRVRSDDLVALTEGRLNFAVAWATGRIKIDAGIADLLRLRALL